MIKKGDKLPCFSLKDHKGNVVDSRQFENRNILLSFHPLAWTPVCAKQMISLEENYDFFEKKNTSALGISVDSSFSKKEWARSLNISKTKLLADFWPHGGLAVKLGLFKGNEGLCQRANVIVDLQGIIKFVKVYPVPEVPDIEEIKKTISEL
ncbi:MAG: redoxin domain-containing protein [Candidatus Muiribacteriota bacterium]